MNPAVTNMIELLPFSDNPERDGVTLAELDAEVKGDAMELWQAVKYRLKANHIEPNVWRRPGLKGGNFGEGCYSLPPSCRRRIVALCIMWRQQLVETQAKKAKEKAK